EVGMVCDVDIFLVPAEGPKVTPIGHPAVHQVPLVLPGGADISGQLPRILFHRELYFLPEPGSYDLRVVGFSGQDPDSNSLLILDEYGSSFVRVEPVAEPIVRYGGFPE